MAKIKKQKITDTEPIIDSTAYGISLASALNYYNDEYQPIDYKNAVMDYVNVISFKLPKGIPEYEFRSIGAVCRLILREQYISIEHLNCVMNKLNKLASLYKETSQPIASEEVTIKKVPSDNTKPFLSWLDNNIDEYLLGRTEFQDIGTQYSVYTFNKGENKKILDYLNTNISNYEKDYKDFSNQEVKEAYSFTTRNVLKELVKRLTEFKKSIEEINSKPVAKSKPRKEKPAYVQVANVPYKKEYEGIKSLHPKEIIGKSVAYIFDTDTREFIILHSISAKFKATGQTIGNLDEAKCVKKKIRKPDEFLKQFSSQLEPSKSSYKQLFDSIKTTEQKAVGRMNENKIILKVL